MNRALSFIASKTNSHDLAIAWKIYLFVSIFQELRGGAVWPSASNTSQVILHNFCKTFYLNTIKFKLKHYLMRSNKSANFIISYKSNVYTTEFCFYTENCKLWISLAIKFDSEIIFFNYQLVIRSTCCISQVFLVSCLRLNFSSNFLEQGTVRNRRLDLSKRWKF